MEKYLDYVSLVTEEELYSAMVNAVCSAASEELIQFRAEMIYHTSTEDIYNNAYKISKYQDAECFYDSAVSALDIEVVLYLFTQKGSLLATYYDFVLDTDDMSYEDIYCTFRDYIEDNATKHWQEREDAK